MIILYSEGRLDLGEDDIFADDDAAGPLRVLLESLLDHCGWVLIEPRLFGKVHGGRESHGLRGFARKVHRVLRDAELNDEQALIIVVDRDGTPGRSRFEELDRGRQDSEVPCAIGVAQEMVEAWLLGDPGAWERAFGTDAPKPPNDPEVRTTANSPSPNSAKQVLRRLLDDANATGSNLQRYTLIARNTRWQALAVGCPRSFKPFAEEVRERIGPMFGVRGSRT